MNQPDPYLCKSNTCSTCIFNESCASEILSDREQGVYLPIQQEMEGYLWEAGQNE